MPSDLKQYRISLMFFTPKRYYEIGLRLWWQPLVIDWCGRGIDDAE